MFVVFGISPPLSPSGLLPDEVGIPSGCAALRTTRTSGQHGAARGAPEPPPPWGRWAPHIIITTQRGITEATDGVSYVTSCSRLRRYSGE